MPDLFTSAFLLIVAVFVVVVVLWVVVVLRGSRAYRSKASETLDRQTVALERIAAALEKLKS
jgi:hypothetical protein